MAKQGISPGVWCGAWVRVAVGFGCVLGLGAGAALVWLLPTHGMLQKGRAGLCWAFLSLWGLKVCQLLCPGEGQHIVW